MRCEPHQHDDHRVGVTVGFDRDELSVIDTPFGLVLELPELGAGGEPVAPALQRMQLRIAVPSPYWPQTLHIAEESWEIVADSSAVVAPVQPHRAGAPTDTPRHGTDPIDEESPRRPDDKGRKDRVPRHEAHCGEDHSRSLPRQSLQAPLTKADPAPPFVVPDPDKYGEAVKNPPPVARAVRIETIGTTRLAVVELAPGPPQQQRRC